MYTTGVMTSAQRWCSCFDRSSLSVFPTFKSVDLLGMPLEVDKPFANFVQTISLITVQTTSALIEVLMVTTTVIETIIPARSTATSWVPSSVFSSPKPGFVDLRTISSYGHLPTSSSQPSLSSALPQPSTTPPTTFADHSRTKTLLITFIGASHVQLAHVANASMPVLAPPKPAEMNFTFNSFLPHPVISVAMSATQPHSPVHTATTASIAISRSLNRTIAAQLPPLVSNLSSHSPNRWPSLILSADNKSLPNSISLMTPDTASSASILGSVSPQSPDRSIEPMKNQALSTEALITATTVHLPSILTSTTLAISIDQALALSCSHNLRETTLCPSSGCVNLKTDKSHCGACNQVCEHGCRQGFCVCPDLAGPDANSECANTPGLGPCATGIVRNVSKVCSQVRTTSLLDSSTSTRTRPAAIEVAVSSLAVPASNEPQYGLTTAFSTQVADLESIFCPPGLPNICNGGCFNTKTEHNHCGGCANFCSGTCIGGRCLAKPTPSRLQLVSSRRTVTVT